MIPSPLRYDVHWTSKLLRRDVKKLTTQFTTKLKTVFNPKGAKTSVPYYHYTEPEIALSESEGFLYSGVQSVASFDVTSVEIPRSSYTIESSPPTTIRDEHIEVSQYCECCQATSY